MNAAIQVVVYALGALALLVVVNWAKQDIVIGLVAAFLVLAVVGIATLRTKVRGDEGAPPTDPPRS